MGGGGPKIYGPQNIVGHGQLKQKSRILDLLAPHTIFFRRKKERSNYCTLGRTEIVSKGSCCHLGHIKATVQWVVGWESGTVQNSRQRLQIRNLPRLDCNKRAGVI